MKTSVKIVLSVFGTLFGIWLAFSVYFLLNGQDELPVENAPAANLPHLAPEENSYGLFDELAEIKLEDSDLSEASDFVWGLHTNAEVLVKLEALVNSHSNVHDCVRKILACRGHEIPPGGYSYRAFVMGKPAAKLLYYKSICEAERGDFAAAKATAEELIAFGRHVQGSRMSFGNVTGGAYIGMAAALGMKYSDRGGDEWWRDFRRYLADYERSIAPAWIAAARVTPSRFEDLEGCRTNQSRFAALLLKDRVVTRAFRVMLSGVKTKLGGEYKQDWQALRSVSSRLLLSSCFGYRNYAIKPGKTFNALCAEVNEYIDKVESGSYDPDYAAYKVRRPNNCLGDNFVGSNLLGNACRSMYREYFNALFMVRAARAKFASLEYHNRNGAWPAALSELVPQYIESVPLDPYDGEPIRYNAGQSYVWTPGPDGNFNGKVEFDEDGYVSLGKPICKHVRIFDETKVHRPAAASVKRRKCGKQTGQGVE